MGFAVDLSGLTTAVLRTQATLAEQAVLRLTEAGEDVLVYAQTQTSFPYDTGSLNASGAVGKPQVDGPLIDVDVTFGGPSGGPNNPVDYAEPVHQGYERVVYGRRTGTTVPGRPYLADPFTEAAPGRLEEVQIALLAAIAAVWRNA